MGLQDREYYRDETSPGGIQFNFQTMVSKLIVVNAGLFIVNMFSSGLLFEYLKASPASLVNISRCWQLLTYGFAHDGPVHILFNMFALWMFGRELEHEWGTREFLRYFIMTGVIAGLSIFAWNTVRGDLIGLTYGASGAVCAVIAAYALFYPEKYIYFNFFIPVKVKYFAVFYVLLELWALPARDGISHIGHLGGMVAGYFYILNKYRHLGIGQNFFRDFFKKKGFQ